MNLIDILITAQTTNSSDHGIMIDFGTIYLACKTHGHDNQLLIEREIEKLDEQGKLSIIYDDEVLIGVKLT